MLPTIPGKQLHTYILEHVTSEVSHSSEYYGHSHLWRKALLRFWSRLPVYYSALPVEARGFSEMMALTY